MRWGALGLAVARSGADLGPKIAVEDEKGIKTTVKAGKAFPLFLSMKRRKRELGVSPFSSWFSPFSSKKKFEGEEPGHQSMEGSPLFFVGEKKEQGGGEGAIEGFGEILPFWNPLC
ncbi:hypothetical protein MRB53_006233 [Persea americana]|uniref:Uncharacterized protein n=1 Tax=Persea americana TaxID=3435 RepID=A0ACC2MFL1_PERAE|nr:hypothetical protein MRB53_006233 [Persea americana]